MSNPTTPFSWQMPTATDLVTDLPADFEVFGQAVATSMADLLGGTTGQVLSKTSNTDMDFTWVAPTTGDITGVTAGVGISGGGTSGDVTVTNSMATAMTTSGDLIQATGSGTFARLGTGTAGQYLTTNGTTNSWATPTSGSLTQLATGTVSGTSITLSSISQSYKHLYLVLSSVQLSAATDLAVRPNNDTAANYLLISVGNATSVATRNTDTLLYLNGGNGPTAPTTANNDSYSLYIQNYATSKAKPITYSQNMAATKDSRYGWCGYINTTAITSLVLCTNSGSATWSVGTYTLYGVN